MVTPLPSLLRRAVAAIAGLVAVAAVAPSLASAAPGPAYVPGQVVVGYAPRTPALTHARLARGADAAAPVAPATRIVTLGRGASVTRSIARLRRERGVLWAVPDYVAHVADTTTTTSTTTTASTALPPAFDPDDPGISATAGGWANVQWDFAPGPFGVGAEQAWGNLIADGAAGGRGVVVAVLDTGIAYRNWGRFRQSPDLSSTQFVQGRDFIDPGAYPVDHNGHGTHVASTLAESTNNGYGLTGLAYGVKLMSVRVLDTSGEGDASVIAQGVRYAVDHGAQVINMSLEFDAGVTASDIPELISAISYAHRRGVVVVAAAGNEGTRTVAYPARARYVISVGATTQHGCLADYSNDGPQLTIVAPGGGADADLPGDPNCHPNAAPGGDIYQVTFLGPNPRKFGIPPGYDGTSMASPHVSATAALVIASKVLGAHPSPDAILARLKATATILGDPADRARYGAGLVNAASATAPGGPGAATL